MSLKDVKTLTTTDDERVDIVYNQTEKRLLSRLKRSVEDLEEIPLELDYVVDEVAIARFNRIGSEGMQSESQDGHTATYVEADFKPYEEDIVAFINAQNEDINKGVVRFL